MLWFIEAEDCEGRDMLINVADIITVISREYGCSINLRDGGTIASKEPYKVIHARIELADTVGLR